VLVPPPAADERFGRLEAGRVVVGAEQARQPVEEPPGAGTPGARVDGARALYETAGYATTEQSYRIDLA
jgi:hypothetical protein